MAKVQYGIPMGATQQGMSNEDIARLLMAQQQQDQSQQQPQYDPLGQALDFQAPHPVYNATQGIADVAGRVGEAYFKRKQLEKLQKAQIGSNQQFASALQEAGNTSLARDQGTGITINKSDFASPVFDQSKVNQSTPLTPNERAQMAYSHLASKNAPLANAVLPQLQEQAKASQPLPISWMDTEPGHTKTPMNPVTNTPLAGGPGIPAPISGGVVPTESSRDAELAGYKPGSPEYQKAMRDRLSKDQPVTWRPASSSEKAQYGIPQAQGARINTLGEVQPIPKEAGQVGPAYDSFSGQPMGIVDYTDPKISDKMKTGEVITHEPHPLATGDIQALTDLGNQIQELKGQQEKFKPEYSRIIGADSALRGFIGGKAFNEGADWINNTRSILLQNTKNVTGRSPQLIKEYNLVRPEASDAGDVIQRKMEGLIELKTKEAANKANTYMRGGHLGSQVVQSIGFDPRGSAVQQPGGAGDTAPDPLGIRR